VRRVPFCGYGWQASFTKRKMVASQQAAIQIFCQRPFGTHKPACVHSEFPEPMHDSFQQNNASADKERCIPAKNKMS
jgi:hypothetical protein